MDGVCCSFTDHALFTHKREEVKIVHWDIESQLGITKKQFQKPINDAGESWWSSVPELPHFRRIVNLANHYFDEVYFLSSPSDYRGACEGKRIWLQRRLGKEFNNFIFTQHKHACAKPDSVLIDDNEENCKRFSEEEGLSICFPQPWNSAREHCGNEIPYLERQLENAVKKIKAYEDWKYHTSEIERLSEEEDFDF